MTFKPQSKNKVFFVLLLLFAFLATPDANAQRKKRNKDKKGDTEKVAPKKKSTEKSIADLTKKSKKIEGLFTIYQDTITGSLQMVVTKEQLEKEFIYFSQIKDGVSEVGAFRGAYRGSKIFTLKKYFNKIEFVAKNTSYYFDPNSALSKSAEANISEGVMASLKIEATDKEKGLYLIKADAIFLKETLSQIKPPRFPGRGPFSFSLGNLDKGKTKINAIKNYPENTDLVIEYVYSKPSVLNGGSNAVTDGRNVTIKVNHSLIQVPDNTYMARYDDPRVGYFTTQVTNMTTPSVTPYKDLIHRWHLEKKDPAAAVSEPVEPITWWIENTTPLEYRETIKEGVLRWNIAFEKAGFKNAMVVKVQPDDAEWDAGDVRYNVLRWTSSPRPPFGGYGPSFVNPRTGQILGADVMLEYVHQTNRVIYDKLFETMSAFSYEDIDKAENELQKFNKQYNYCSLGHLMHENSVFGNTALTLMNASEDEKEVLRNEGLTHLIMHEVGHTLGLNHNMKSSQLHSPAQLADKNYIQGKALTGSVMDYEAINVTNDRTQQGHYFTTTLGPYDLWAIEFGYKPVTTYKELDDILKRSTEPELIFGNDADDMRSPGKAIDPRVMVGDLSNDQITYSVNRINLVNEMTAKLRTKYSDYGKSYQELVVAYSILQGQKSSALNVISRFIGGIYVDRAMQGQVGGTQPYTPVSYADQKRAMKALKDYLFAPNANDVPKDLYTHLARQRRGFNFFGGPEDPKIHSAALRRQMGVLYHILHPNTLQRIVDSELYGNEYKLPEYMRDLNKAIFNADINTSVNSFRQNLQLAYTDMLIQMLTGKVSGRFSNVAKSMAIYNLKTIRRFAANNLGDLGTKAHKMHLKTLIDNAMKEIK
ncbi:zinc-dependent metalloprotease [Kordia sp. YSTF-M3]|uniref:Zinc-dependent metalloprotease n=1 Tax=Kordia aestuariivivens TaxID=2759037 RepID=A0ABR7QCY9_9FLAO|nr:zinc-dependent metalloprotease [Kordia aestuariivivens]MBC8756358.1 zinc-dependent metalloprotease [Kordia aestuariivivens]